MPKQIVAVALVTHDELALLGPTFSRALLRGAARGDRQR